MTQETEQTTAVQVYDASNTLQEMTQAGNWTNTCIVSHRGDETNGR